MARVMMPRIELVLLGGQNSLCSDRLCLIQLEWNDLFETALGESQARVASMLFDASFVLHQVGTSGELVRFEPLSVPGYGGDVFAAKGEAREFLQRAPSRSHLYCGA
jgi:hypothetical protein